LKEPKSSLLLFKNGKIICTGCKTEKEVKYAIKSALALLQKAQKKR
jgi:TATA-box binding protein (TBP) (component of TFIID and TFIIIB)